MHDAYIMQQAASSKYTSNKYQVKMYNIHPFNLIPPTHVFNGEFLFLGFLVWASILIGDIKYRLACQSLKAVKYISSISKYKGFAQSLLAQNGVTRMGFQSMDLGFYRWKYFIATFTSNLGTS